MINLDETSMEVAKKLRGEDPGPVFKDDLLIVGGCSSKHAGLLNKLLEISGDLDSIYEASFVKEKVDKLILEL